MMTEAQKERKREYTRRYRLKHNLAVKEKVSSKSVIKLFGLRTTVGTFDKHNPQSIYFDGVINCVGTNDTSALACVEDELREVFYKWIKNQDDYDRKRNIRIVKALIECKYGSYISKNKHIKFDIALVQNRTPKWKESVEIARKHILALYDEIAKAIVKNGLVLKDFKGHNPCGRNGKPCNLQATVQ